MTNPAPVIRGPFGDLAWSLPHSFSYIPGQEIGVVLYVTNLINKERSYSLRVRELVGGLISNESLIKVNESDKFQVGACEQATLLGTVVATQRCTLVVELIDRETGIGTDSQVVELV